MRISIKPYRIKLSVNDHPFSDHCPEKLKFLTGSSFLVVKLDHETAIRNVSVGVFDRLGEKV